MPTTVPTVIDGDDLTDDFTLKVKAACDELQALTTTGSWTPGLTNVAIGTGGGAGVTGTWRYANGLLSVRIALTLGTTGASVTGVPGITLPGSFTQTSEATTSFLGVGVSLTAGGNLFRGEACYGSATSINLYAMNVAATYATRTAITNLIPGTWVAGDSMVVRGVILGTF